MKKVLFAILALAAVLLAPGPDSARAAAAPTYGDYALTFTNAAGQYWSGNQAGGKWQQAPQSATESWIYWGDPAKTWPPSYHEQFVHQVDASGDWLVLPGWFDNGTFYAVRTTTEWQAAADCRTGRTFLPTGGPQHYVRWSVPAAAYCLYAEGTIREESSGKTMQFVHQQVWSPPAACPANAYGLATSSCITQWESWSDSIGTPLQLKLERTDVLGYGLGPAFNIRQSSPSVWGADLRWQRTCASFC